MATTVPFTLITPRATVFDGEAELVIAVGTEGEVGVLPSHAPFLTALRPGVLRANVRDGEGSRRIELACAEGFLQALPGKVTILTDAALAREEIDAGAARSELAEAENEQKAAGTDLAAYGRAQAKIDFANAKLAVSGLSH